MALHKKIFSVIFGVVASFGSTSEKSANTISVKIVFSTNLQKLKVFHYLVLNVAYESETQYLFANLLPILYNIVNTFAQSSKVTWICLIFGLPRVLFPCLLINL